MPSSRAYYNEIDSYAADWLRNLIAEGLIAPGDVDDRSIADVQPGDLRGYTQCHFFAGIGGWSLAARMAGWPDDRPLWTGSCPCQPFSVAGQGKGNSDARHLWPEFFRLIEAGRPAVVMGEQVAAAVGKHWLDGVFTDLEGIGYAGRAAVAPACAVDAPHRRDRLWFVGHDQIERRGERQSESVVQWGRSAAAGASVPDGALGYQNVDGRQQPEGCERQQWRRFGDAGSDGPLPDAGRPGLPDAQLLRGCQPEEMGNGQAEQRQATAQRDSARGHWADAVWITGHDGKARRVKPGVRLLASGVPNRVGQLRALGNAIVPQVAAEIIGAFLDAERDEFEVGAAGGIAGAYAGLTACLEEAISVRR